MIKNNEQSGSADQGRPTILILGIGNLLLGDEGIGVHMIRYLEKMDFPDHVTLLDGGTGGFHLLSHLQHHDHIILIDATLDDKPEGSIEVLEPSFSTDFPPSLSSHEIGLKDLIDSLYLLDSKPEMTLVLVTIKHIQPMTVELSEPIQHIRKKVAEQILDVLRNIDPGIPSPGKLV